MTFIGGSALGEESYTIKNGRVMHDDADGRQLARLRYTEVWADGHHQEMQGHLKSNGKFICEDSEGIRKGRREDTMSSNPQESGNSRKTTTTKYYLDDAEKRECDTHSDTTGTSTSKYYLIDKETKDAVDEEHVLALTNDVESLDEAFQGHHDLIGDGQDSSDSEIEFVPTPRFHNPHVRGESDVSADLRRFFGLTVTDIDDQMEAENEIDESVEEI